tara:strand:- start:1046 stop:2023 length:978 start_codon:yes stop_codon:yes gene_type:complete
MKFRPIILVAGEPKSVFLELLFKIYKSNFFKTYKRPIVLVASKQLILKQMKILNYKIKITDIYEKEINRKHLNNKSINLINIDFEYNYKFNYKTKKYITNCFKKALSIMSNNSCFALINGPISKINFLEKKYLGITEYLSKKTNSKNNEVMLIYNKNFAVSPITTHQPLNKVSKSIRTNLIVKKIKLINNFYKKYFNKKIRIAVCGLNPHCETVNKFSEEDKIITPAIKILKKKKINLKGPLPADTLFLPQNIKKFDVFVGMYHDQVLTPIKALVGFNAINITLGLPFLRISPDHGPNSSMFGKNKSNPSSLIQCLLFLKKIRGN